MDIFTLSKKSLNLPRDNLLLLELHHKKVLLTMCKRYEIYIQAYNLEHKP